MRKICFVTGGRSDFDLISSLMKKVDVSPTTKLQLVVTGSHLSLDYGLTYRNIEKENFYIDRKVDISLSSNNAVAISKSIGLGLIGFSEAFSELNPDILVLLGDRFEIFAAAASALVAKIPVAHLHGGELTEGSIDDAFRHSITKMSHFHFVAREEYKNRVIQLGENPGNVYVVGGLGADNIKNLKLETKSELEKKLKVKFLKKTLIVTYHPVTLQRKTNRNAFGELLKALRELKDTTLVFTYPNPDEGGLEIIKMINEFVDTVPMSYQFQSLGMKTYLSCVSISDGVIGNSSSGLLEVPSLGKGTVNIGERQAGRVKAASVIDCEPDKKSIIDAINTLYSLSFTEKLSSIINPYASQCATDQIFKVINEVKLDNIVNKKFYSL